MNPFQEAFRRTTISLKRRWQRIALAGVFGLTVSLNLSHNLFALVSGTLLGALVPLGYILATKFPKHYRRAIQDS